ncbi:xylulokinase [Rhizobium herbae]|uniref:Xylulokinase n=1 Tax=Rhizobium herbae TaxID=508661 RepID=A0ABS4EQ20_9HYPH|nr:FGGY family carbohydrate kinase [Rhizobium herbae]MBP1860028.1 xylulokinase [Rhizobium herbae]
MRDLVIGIDASTTAIKAVAMRRDGTEVAQTRATYPLSSPAPGHFEQDAEHWWTALLEALSALARIVDPARFAGLSIAHQRETFTLINAAGKPLIPAILWLDERARPQVARLSEELGRDTIREWSGKPPDPTPALYALAWLKEHRSDLLRSAHAIVDVHAFLVRRLTGELVTSTASADPLGIFSPVAGKWHPELVKAAGLTKEQLPRLVAPGELCGTLTPETAGLTGLPAALPIFAGAGDGQAAGLGMGVTEPGKAYLSLGSGVVSGMFSDRYVTSDAYRTLTAPISSGFMLETVLRSGMQLADWAVRTLNAGSAAELEALAKTVPPGAEGMMVLPYWAGVMNPYWDEAARGVIIGAALHHKPAHIFRATLEGIAFEQAIATAAMEKSCGVQATGFVAAGGGTNCRLLLDIMATVLDRPLSVSPVNEAAALGGGMLAAMGAGWFASAGEAGLAMRMEAAETVYPVAKLGDFYRKKVAIYRDIYPATRDLHRRLLND